MSDHNPTEWNDLREARHGLANRKARWLGGKALAVILLAVVALAATSHLIDWVTPQPQSDIILHFADTAVTIPPPVKPANP
jgi:hypothetical protein